MDKRADGYLFGHSDVAARRLAVLAEVFASSTVAFLEAAAPAGVELAVDLGCGPGLTTRLIADTLGCRQVVRLDIADGFLELARGLGNARLAFDHHDVTAVPFPAGPADLLFCRFLLTHLRDPQAAVAAWATQLRPGGRLLLEEVERIETDNPLFRRYLDLVAASLRDRGMLLDIGPLLDAALHPRSPSPSPMERGTGGEAGGPRRRVSSEVRRLVVADRRAATMFNLNLRTLRESRFVRASYDAAFLAELEAGLAATAAGGDGSSITWQLRQIALEPGA